MKSASPPSIHRLRRRALLAVAALAAVLSWPIAPADAQSTLNWVGTFGKAPAGPPAEAETQVLTNQTVRLVAHTSIGGNRVRVRVSNEMGSTALRIGAAHIALRQGGAQIAAGTDRVLTFNGATSVIIPAGAPVLSDPVSLSFPALSDLVVSLHLPTATRLTTVHPNARQTTYVSTPGNFTGAATFPVQRTTSWAFLTEVDVTGRGGAIVALGDSITDGSLSTNDTNNRWPDLLARRLRDSGTSPNVLLGVVSRSISGNRLLTSAPPGSLGGRNGLERFERDVLATAGARYLIILLGINDLGYSNSSAPVTAANLISGYRQLIARAHSRGIAVIGATLLPFQGAGYYSLQKDTQRQAVNLWIRTGKELDGVIDFDFAMRDPASPLRLLPAYDSGDHLHPGNLGYQAMANAVPLALFAAGAGPMLMLTDEEAAATPALPEVPAEEPPTPALPEVPAEEPATQ
jgi:lysophospholipase L1-like esterase